MDIWLFNETHQPQQLSKLNVLPKHGFAWIDFSTEEFNRSTEQIKNLTGVTLHERHLQDCLNTQHPSFYDSTENYDFLIFRDINLSNQKSNLINTIPVIFIVFDRLLATINSDTTIAQIKTRFQETSRHYPNQPEILGLNILNTITDNFLALRTPLTEQYNHWQQSLLRKKRIFAEWIAFLGFKKNITQLEMLCEEQQDVLDQWRESMIDAGTNENLTVRFNDLSNHLLRVLRFTQRIRKELDTLIELHYSIVSGRTSEIVKVLTVISAIFLPLNLVAGFFGMNFEHMPLIRDHYGVVAIFIVMLLIVAFSLSLFRYKKWL